MIYEREFTVKTAYLAIEEFTKEIEFELNRAHIPFEKKGLLYLTQSPEIKIYFCQQVWRDYQIAPIRSIKEAATILKTIQRNWAPYSFELHRRVALIQEALPFVSGKPIKFLQEIPKLPMGAYTLLDQDTLMYASSTNSLYPLGAVQFIEDKINPPSRAYLKLWEPFTIRGLAPNRGENCLDMGACPGGWTWVLAELGCLVTSVDKAPLEPRILEYPNVKFHEGSAFALDPKDFTQIDWFYSDIICYPDRLYTLVKKWMDSGKVKNFLCTIKFQGETDYSAIDKFMSLPNAEIFHSYHNKHELTFVSLSH
jgi:23S rRNA (cytidine2498-2'-O)-methyltransferase